MAKNKMDELFTPYTQRAALAKLRPPKIINIIYKNGRYCLDAFGRYWALPARWDGLWRRLRGRRVRTFALALAVAGGAAWVAWRLFETGR